MTHMPRQEVLNVKGRIPIFALLYIICFALPIQTSISGLVFTPLRLLLLIVIVPLTVNLLRGCYGRLLLVDTIFLLHMLWAVASMTANNPDRVVAFMGSNSLEFIGGYVLARASIQNIDDFQQLCRLLILAVIVTFPLAIYETLTGDPIVIRIIRSIPGITSNTIAYAEPRFGLQRVQVFLSHPIHYGLFASFALSLIFVGFRDDMTRMKRYLLTLIVLVCIMLSLSSGALLAALLQIGLITWAWVFRSYSWRWILFFITCIAAYITVDLLSNRTPVQVFMHYATFNAHTAFWRGIIFDWGMKNVWDNPFFGIGLNDWERPVYMRSGSMDNFWLVMAVRYGIPGFLLLVFGYISALWCVGFRNLDGDQPFIRFRQAWMICMAGLTFTLATVHIWGELYSFVFFFFGAGMWMLIAKPNAGNTMDHSSAVKDIRLTQGFGLKVRGGKTNVLPIGYTRFPSQNRE